MVSINLDATQAERLDKLARSLGTDSDKLAGQIVVNFLDFQALPTDSAEDWAEAAVALAPEVMAVEAWD